MLGEFPKWLIITLYFLGGGAFFYLGMRFEWARVAKHMHDRTLAAYHRGWVNGRDFVERIDDVKTDMESAVRILGASPAPFYDQEREDQNA